MCNSSTSHVIRDRRGGSGHFSFLSWLSGNSKPNLNLNHSNNINPFGSIFLPSLVLVFYFLLLRRQWHFREPKCPPLPVWKSQLLFICLLPRLEFTLQKLFGGMPAPGFSAQCEGMLAFRGMFSAKHEDGHKLYRKSLGLGNPFCRSSVVYWNLKWRNLQNHLFYLSFWSGHY